MQGAYDWIDRSSEAASCPSASELSNSSTTCGQRVSTGKACNISAGRAPAEESHPVSRQWSTSQLLRPTPVTQQRPRYRQRPIGSGELLVGNLAADPLCQHGVNRDEANLCDRWMHRLAKVANLCLFPHTCGMT